MFNIKSFLFIVFILSLSHYSSGQFKDYSFGEGFRYNAKDSTFDIKATFRFQSLFEGNWRVNNDDLGDIGNLSSNFLIRRARLKFDGFAYSPKLTYKVELALSNRDINHNNPTHYGEGGNIVLDAYLNWNFHSDFSIKVGQFKLAGNRERIVSSANLQFVDRSTLNSRFTLDRDIGASLHYDKTLGERFGLHLSAALTQGDGRNIISGNKGGHQTTFKVEIMPFGEFTNNGAYVQSAVYREQKPELAFAVAFDKNHGAARTNGNKGAFLPVNAELKDLMTGFADFMFKYKGLSVMGEYTLRKTNGNGNGVFDDSGNYLDSYRIGSALNLQAGYLFKNNFEVAARYTYVTPLTYFGSPNVNHYTLGFSKYLTGHNLKIQTDLGYIQNYLIDDGLTWRFQIEIGF